MKTYPITRIGCWVLLAVFVFSALFFLKILWTVLQSPLFWITLAVIYVYRKMKEKSTIQQAIKQRASNPRQQDLNRYEMYETLDEEE